MHDERSCPGRDAGALTAARKDANAERSVLCSVLEAYPALFTEDELVREIADNPEDFGQRDTVERAIGSLFAVGLLHRLYPVLVPSRGGAAVRRRSKTSERPMNPVAVRFGKNLSAIAGLLWLLAGGAWPSHLPAPHRDQPVGARGHGCRGSTR